MASSKDLCIVRWKSMHKYISQSVYIFLTHYIRSSFLISHLDIQFSLFWIYICLSIYLSIHQSLWINGVDKKKRSGFPLLVFDSLINSFIHRFCKAQSSCVSQAILKAMILLPQLSEWFYYRYSVSHLALFCLIYSWYSSIYHISVHSTFILRICLSDNKYIYLVCRKYI